MHKRLCSLVALRLHHAAVFMHHSRNTPEGWNLVLTPRRIFFLPPQLCNLSGQEVRMTNHNSNNHVRGGTEGPFTWRLILLKLRIFETPLEDVPLHKPIFQKTKLCFRQYVHAAAAQQLLAGLFVHRERRRHVERRHLQSSVFVKMQKRHCDLA